MDVVSLRKRSEKEKRNETKDSRIMSKIRKKLSNDPHKNGWKLKIRSESAKRILRVRQKNIQLRLDQIKKLREYAFWSGNMDGIPLNDSEVCRAALDFFFSLEIDPRSISSEKELLNMCKRKMEKSEGG